MPSTFARQPEEALQIRRPAHHRHTPESDRRLARAKPVGRDAIARASAMFHLRAARSDPPGITDALRESAWIPQDPEEFPAIVQNADLDCDATRVAVTSTAPEPTA